MQGCGDEEQRDGGLENHGLCGSCGWVGMSNTESTSR
jgi:hypothetical protein